MAEPNVTLRIKVDARDGTASVQAFSGAVEQAGKKSTSSFSDVAAAAGKVGAAVAAAAAAVLSGVGVIARNAIQGADALDEMAQRTGVAASELSTLAFAAQRGGLDLGTFESGLIKLTKSASDTARGTGEARAGFEALGISVTNVDGTLKSSDVLLREVADKMSTVTNESERTAIAISLFGRAGSEMIPLLNEGADGIEALQARARDLGLEVQDTTAALAGEFNDALDDMQSLVKGVGNDVAAALLPGLTELARVFVDNAVQGRQAAGAGEQFAEGIKTIIGVGIAGVAQVQKLGAAMGAVGAQVDVFFSTIGANFEAFQQYQEDVFELGPIDAFVKFTEQGFANVGSAIDRAGSNLDALNDSFADIDADAERKIAALNTRFEATADVAGRLVGGSGSGGGPSLGRGSGLLGKVGDELADIGNEANFAKSEVDPFRVAIERLLGEIERAQVDQLAADMVQLQIALDEAISEGDVERANRIREALVALGEQGAQGFDTLREAGIDAFATLADEGKALEDALSAAMGDFFSGNIDSFEDFADSIESIFRNLIADLVQQWVRANIFGQGQNGAGGVISQLFGGVGQGGGSAFQLGSGFMGIAAGGLLGYGATGSIGGALGGAAGSWVGGIGATMATQAVAAGAIGSTLGGILGSALPIVGTLLGAALGDAIAGLFGDDPKPRLRINATGAGIGNIGTRGTTALGTLAFNADDLEDTRGTERQLLEAIQALDQGFVTLVNTFDLGQTQLDALRDAASRWSIDLRNSAITGEAVLGSRFGALLDTFDEHIVSFVGSAGTLEERMGRLTEALFIDAAAASGELVDDFDQLVELLDQFGREGEAVDATYGRLLQSTRLLEDALGMMGQNLDLSREAFVAFAAEITDAAGGLEQATALWSNYFETFYSEQERAELLVSRASQQAAEQFADIGLAVEDFMGSTGLADFRALFERELPSLTAEQVVQWLEAANALGFLGEASAALAEILARAAAEVVAGYNALANATKPGGPPEIGFPIDGLNPGLPAEPGGPVPTNATPPWYTPGMAGGPVIVNPGDPTYPGYTPGGIGSEIDREIDRRYERELDWLRRLADLQDSLLLDEQLTTLTPAERLAEIERQYQTAFTGALGGDEAARQAFDGIARQFADIGRGFFGSSSGYDDLFARILADIGTLRAASPATTAASVVNTALTNSTPPPAAGAQGDQIAALRADFAAAMDQLVTISERQVQLETRIAVATEVTAQNTGTPLFPQRTIG